MFTYGWDVRVGSEADVSGIARNTLLPSGSGILMFLYFDGLPQPSGRFTVKAWIEHRHALWSILSICFVFVPAYMGHSQKYLLRCVTGLHSQWQLQSPGREQS